MRDLPEIIKILREEERLGKLHLEPSTSSKESLPSEIPSDTKPDKTTETEYITIKQKNSEEKLEHYQKKIEEQIKQLKKLDKIKSNWTY